MRNEFGESVVADYMASTYFREIDPSDLLEEVAVHPTAGADDTYIWSGHWRGALGQRPGTGSGNQATEAFHTPFQKEISAAGGHQPPPSFFERGASKCFVVRVLICLAVVRTQSACYSSDIPVPVRNTAHVLTLSLLSMCAPAKLRRTVRPSGRASVYAGVLHEVEEDLRLGQQHTLIIAATRRRSHPPVWK